jgi:signal transduction histidine kinase
MPRVETPNLRLTIRTGLTGLIDRVEALGGTMEISSHTGNGTSLLVNIPFEVQITERELSAADREVGRPNHAP